MKKLLIIGQVWPESKSSAAGWRMNQLIDSFIKSNYQIHFACAAATSEFSDDLIEKGVLECSIQLNNPNFDAFIKELSPGVVLFDRFVIEEMYGWRVAEQCPDAVRILDTEDLHFLRKARQLSVNTGAQIDVEALQSEDAVREIASMFRCDLTLIISDYELDLLKNVFNVPERLLVYLPFESELINEAELLAKSDFESRAHFMFIGNFIHAPNFDAVLHLKKNIWNLIRSKLPNAELHIYGAYQSQKISQLHNKNEGFLIKGRANSATEVISKARVMLAPLRFGAGIKGKLLEAMQCGTPSVTTKIGAEGMKGDLAWNGFVAEDVEEFASFAIQLYNDPEIWKESIKNGVKINNQRFAQSAPIDLFMQRLQVCEANISQYRQLNFLGKMLLHNSMQSTKYFSRWIEEKNK
ncbi:MAG: glycosyltransferase involved in cell wall biosynthesis [Flavobacteriales bacterium]